MVDKCLRNELMDIKCINNPNFMADLKSSDCFVYADFMKPGYHQILIYDPLLEKAFCKDFMVSMNLREDLFPEFPIMDGVKIKVRIKNVFDEWREDSAEDQIKAFGLDMEYTNDVNIEKLVKDEDDR